MPENAVSGFDLTIPALELQFTTVISFLKEWCKKWVFQKEKADSGYIHFQVRCSLIKKRRLNEIIGVTKLLLPPGHHWSVTTTGVHEGQNFSYVMKADSRLEGPWNDKDDGEDPPVLTRQLKEFLTKDFYPWQTTVYEWCKEQDDRSIKLVYDRKGNLGKSIFAEYLEYHQMAYEIPPFRLLEDIMACVLSVKANKAYIIDMPRALKKDKLAEFYSGLECLKNGIAFDKRYSFKKRRFDRPQVIVFTNTLPDWNFMSKDRWIVYETQDDKSITPYANQV